MLSVDGLKRGHFQQLALRLKQHPSTDGKVEVSKSHCPAFTHVTLPRCPQQKLCYCFRQLASSDETQICCLDFTKLTCFPFVFSGFSNSVSDMFRRKPLHPHGEFASLCIIMIWKLFSCTVDTSRCAGSNLFMLCFTDQGEVWERMQGMFGNTILNLRLCSIQHSLA